MKCLIFSDSHNYSGFMRRAILKNPDTDVVFFLGDGLLDIEDASSASQKIAYLAVRGNCDRESIALGACVPKTGSIELCGKKIVYTHGDLYGVKFGIDGLCALAREQNADIVLFGHTHSPVSAYIPAQEKATDEKTAAEKPFYLFNPGSVGMLGSPTFGILTLTEGQEPLFSFGSFA